MADVHFFDIRIAKLYGINCAVILQNIWHWVQKNEANGTNFYDGSYWTYNSTKAFAKQFPYLSQRQIETALKKLRDDGIIKTGNYNAVQYDRTLWYAVTEKGKSILHGCEMEITPKGNGFTPEGKPIPDINADGTSNRDLYKSIVGYLNEKAGTNYKHTTKNTQTHIRGRLSEGFTEEQFKIVIDKKVKDWGKDPKMSKYLRPETLFGPKFEGYLNENPKGGKANAKSDGYDSGTAGKNAEGRYTGEIF